jgi:cell division protein FtsI/penicillin-binding protein 2
MLVVFRWMSAAAVVLTLVSSASGHPKVDLDGLERRGSSFVAPVEGGGLAELTLDASLQSTAEAVLASYDVPFGAAVAISIPDGRVLALAARSTADPSLGPAELTLHPWAPAASVFKIVAASALVGEAALSGTTRACYHGGVSAVLPDNLVDLPRLDRRCDSLGYGLGKSQNAIIAKLAARHLAPRGLGQMAAAFGFGAPLDFDATEEVEPSEVDVPEEPLEFARAAAGFWHSTLSPLHGALIAAAVANGGEMPAPRLIERAVDGRGRPLPLERRPARRVLEARVAQEVGRMMELTTRIGTARGAFRDRRGHPYLPVEVAGKTGTLFYRGRPTDPAVPAAVVVDPGHLGYSWFVGFAPARQPRIAFAVALGNKVPFRVRAALVARRLLASYLAESPGTGVIAAAR